MLSTLGDGDEKSGPTTVTLDQTATVPIGSRKARDLEINKGDKTDVRLELGTKAIPAYSKASTVGGQAVQYAQTTSNTKSGLTSRSPANEKKSGSSIAAAAVIAVALGGGYYAYTNGMLGIGPTDQAAVKTEQAAFATLNLEANVTAATITINDKVVGESFPRKVENLPTGQTLRVVVSSNGYQKTSQDLNLQPGETRSVKFTLAREDGTVPATTLVDGRQIPVRLNIIPLAVGTETSVKINGAAVDALAAVARVTVGSQFDVEVVREGYRPYRKQITVTEGMLSGKEEWVEDVQLHEAKYGFVSLKTSPSADAYFEMDGVQEKITTPFSRKRMAVGSYKVKLVNDALGMEKMITVNVTEDGLSNVEEHLSVVGSDSAPVPTERAPSSK